MEEEEIKRLLNNLFNLKYQWRSESDVYTSDVISKENRSLVETVIRKHLLEMHDKKVGILEGKVFSYEQIISKSNFSIVLEDK